MSSTKALIPVLLVLALASGVAEAKVQIEYRGYVSSDFRFTLPGKPFERDAWKFARNENRLRCLLEVKVNKHIAAKADAKLTMLGFNRAANFLQLTQREEDEISSS